MGSRRLYDLIDGEFYGGVAARVAHFDRQGQGPCVVMHKRLAELAVARGVRGFVAEVLAGNEAMIRLAQTSAADVKTLSLGGTVQITALF